MAAGSSVSSGLGIISGLIQGRVNAAQNDRLARYAFDRSTTYNNFLLNNQPTMQKHALESAGLSPALLSNGGFIQSPATVDSPAGQSTAQFNPVLLDTQLALLDSSRNKNNADALNSYIKAVETSELLPHEKESLIQEAFSKHESGNYSHELAITEQLLRPDRQNEINASAADKYASANLKDSERVVNDAMTSLYHAQQNEIYTLLPEKIKEIQSSIFRNEAAGKLDEATAQKAYQETKNLEVAFDNLLKDGQLTDAEKVEVIKRSALVQSQKDAQELQNYFEKKFGEKKRRMEIVTGYIDSVGRLVGTVAGFGLGAAGMIGRVGASATRGYVISHSN